VSLSLEAFRDLFPALERFVWLNTPTVPPGALPVLEALRRAQDDWERGEFSWQGWEAEAYATRELFARLIGAPDDSVALVGSVAEAASLVAASLPPGRVVVGSREFHSNLLPWLALRDDGREVTEVPAAGGVVSTKALADAIDDRTALVAVSEVQSSNGYRIDLPELAARCREAGARLFVNLTQAAGALRLDAAEVRPDFATATGYKWLLGPRGAAWLHVRSDRRRELKPFIPNWHSVEEPYADYYGAVNIARGMGGLDTSFSWFPYVGARAALELIGSLDATQVEQRCLDLARRFRDGVRGLGFEQSPEEVPSQIVAISVPDAERVRTTLKEGNIIAAVRAGSIRFGFHAFNDEADVAAALDALARAKAARAVG
jgi:selenocysteine lyase/cysteine desulfurase